MAIDQNISQFPPAPDSATDTPEEFSIKADAFVLHQSANYVIEVNQWATEANALAVEANESAVDAEAAQLAAEVARDASAASATESETSATASATSAGESATSAGESATSAGESATSATASATSAGESATSAAEALVSAGDAADSAFIAVGAANYRGDWDIATAYLVGESVSKGDVKYNCKQDNTGMDPETEPDYWFSLEIGSGTFFRIDGTSVMTGDIDAGSNLVKNIGQATVAGDAVEFQQWQDANASQNTSITAAQADIDTHEALVDNPHAVTAAQAGALPIIGGELTGTLSVLVNILYSPFAGSPVQTSWSTLNQDGGLLFQKLKADGSYAGNLFWIHSTDDSGGPALEFNLNGNGVWTTGGSKILDTDGGTLTGKIEGYSETLTEAKCKFGRSSSQYISMYGDAVGNFVHSQAQQGNPKVLRIIAEEDGVGSNELQIPPGGENFTFNGNNVYHEGEYSFTKAEYGGTFIGLTMKVEPDDSIRMGVYHDGDWRNSLYVNDTSLIWTDSNADQHTVQEVTVGDIKLYYGDITKIGKGWNICDGTKGTPDLTGSFLTAQSGDTIPYIMYIGV